MGFLPSLLPSLASFKILSLSFIFLPFEDDKAKCRYFGIFPVWWFWASWIYGLESDSNSGEFLVIIASNICALSFHILLVFTYVYVTPFVIFPQSLDILFCLYSFFFLFTFQFWKFLSTFLQGYFFPQLCPFIDEPIKDNLPFC